MIIYKERRKTGRCQYEPTEASHHKSLQAQSDISYDPFEAVIRSYCKDERNNDCAERQQYSAYSGKGLMKTAVVLRAQP